ncbi:HEAT repeat domain-containing protein [Mesorhizobium sp. M0991]|uniref:HEAT repeat domain-containing protein n=1 Tax=Mesorhizobium sp. M0991 TaxID=2957043 RepID=UPI003338E19D
MATDIVRQHAERAAFLWAQRDNLLASDPPDPKAIDSVGQRLAINLDGLRIASASAWPFLLKQYEDFSEKGELFALGWAALELMDNGRVGQVVEFGRLAPDSTPGLLGALAWHDAMTIAPFVREWIGSGDAFKRLLAVSACQEHSVDPKHILVRLVRDSDAKVCATSARLAGTLKRTDLARELFDRLVDRDEFVRLWAAWALTELGSGDAARDNLKKAVPTAGVNALVAMRAVVKAGPEKEVRAWMGRMMTAPVTAPLAVRGIGMLGDRRVLNWLVDRMREPQLAIAAGAAFLELFPEAREDGDLFTIDATEAGKPFLACFVDGMAKVPLADKVEAWGRAAGLLVTR